MSRDNDLTAVSHEELEFYRELEFLDLSGNKLIRLEKAPFYRMGKLRVLNLRVRFILLLLPAPSLCS